jgi:hypothetical protein
MYVIIQIREAEKNVVRKEETKLNTFIAEEQSLERNTMKSVKSRWTAL